MLTSVLIGTGNVASHLFDAFMDADNIGVQQVFGRNTMALEKFSKHALTTTKSSEIIDADVYIIAVSDDAIEEVSKIVLNKEGIIAHTSGSVPMNVIQHSNSGVFYPLQTFTKGKKVDFSKIPICIEARHDNHLEKLKTFAQNVSTAVYEISSEQREKLHIAAVFANNFSNHLFKLAEELCQSEDLPFEILKPLIYETTHKLKHLSPKAAQTGPARRNDIQTMQKHLDGLENPVHKKIYQLLSESIKSNHEEEL